MGLRKGEDSHVSSMIANGMNIADVLKRLGHSDIIMILTYILCLMKNTKYIYF